MLEGQLVIIRDRALCRTARKTIYLRKLKDQPHEDPRYCRANPNLYSTRRLVEQGVNVAMKVRVNRHPRALT